MDLRPGYKQTEIGVIPEDWEVVSASDVGVFRGGNGFPVVHQGASFGDYPFFKVSDMNLEGNAESMVNSNNWISEETRKYIGATVFPKNAIVFAKVGAAVFLERKKILVQPSCIDNNMAAYVVDAKLADYRFIHFLFLRIRLGGLVATTALPALNARQLGEIKVALPPKAEQSSIADAIADIDASITSLSFLANKKRDVRAGSMQRLLTGQTRLPGFSEAWHEKRLGDHVSFLKNGVQSRAQLTLNDPIRYLHYGDIHVAKSLRLNIRETEMPRVPTLEAARLSRLEDGDLVFVDASEDLAGVGKSVEIMGADGIEAVAGQHTIAARFDKDVLADGFKGYLQHIPAFTTHLRRLAAGTKVYATNRKHIASAEVLLPEPEEQRAIVRVLSDMDAEITTLEARLEKTRALKQGMMQALLTGRVRLPVQGEALDTLEVAHA